MVTLLELGRYALEGVEVLFGFGTVAILGAGLMAAHHAEHPAGDAAPPTVEAADALHHAA